MLYKVVVDKSIERRLLKNLIATSYLTLRIRNMSKTFKTTMNTRIRHLHYSVPRTVVPLTPYS